MALTSAQRDDLEYLLTQVLDAHTPVDELALLRVALRKYIDGMTATQALQWASAQLSNSISSHP